MNICSSNYKLLKVIEKIKVMKNKIEFLIAYDQLKKLYFFKLFSISTRVPY